jgi:hypothetical protein
MIKTELLLTVLLTVIVAGSLSVASFDSSAQNFFKNDVIEFSSSTVVLSSGTSSVNCIVKDCFTVMMTTGMIDIVTDFPRDGGVYTSNGFIDYEKQLRELSSEEVFYNSYIKTTFSSDEYKHYLVELFE